MNINNIVRRIKRSIGIYGIALPIDNLDQYIMDVLMDTTLPVFSIYQPAEEKIPIDTTQMGRPDHSLGEGSDLFILPEQLFLGRELLYVIDVEYHENFLAQNYAPTSFGLHSSVDVMEELMLANAATPMYNAAIEPISFHYEHPRKLYIFNALVSTKLMLTVGFSHDTSFQSITPTSTESFFQLAILDVKEALYNLVKHHNEMETSLDRVDLKLDDWANASGERKDLLKEWDESYLLDMTGLTYG